MRAKTPARTWATFNVPGRGAVRAVRVRVPVGRFDSSPAGLWAALGAVVPRVGA